MAKYYVNKKAQVTGEHEVHKVTCSRLPLPENLEYVGEYYNCHEAITAAKLMYPHVDGCYYCVPDCHTR